jgi:hypothetical protein
VKTAEGLQYAFDCSLKLDIFLAFNPKPKAKCTVEERNWVHDCHIMGGQGNSTIFTRFILGIGVSTVAEG